MRVEKRLVDSIIVKERVRDEDDDDDLSDLKTSLGEDGLLQAIAIMPDSTLVFGFRRLCAAKELGWDEIDVRVLRNIESAAEQLRYELRENTCRRDLTLTQMERGWQQLRQLLKPLVPDGRPPKDLRPPGRRSTVHGQVAELAAAKVGSSRQTMERVAEVREVAEDETQPEPVRTVAKEEYDKLKAATSGATQAQQRVRAAIKEQEAEQGHRRRDPKPLNVTDWLSHLHRTIGSDGPLRRTADELWVAQDDAWPHISNSIDTMTTRLQRQIIERQYLRKMLLDIKKGKA